MSDMRRWERQLLADHDLTELADCVQVLRVLGWTAALSLGTDAMVWWENLEEFQPVIRRLNEVARNDGDSERRALAHCLARLFRRVHNALAAEPRHPTESEVVRRYVAGQIGARTAQYVLHIDSWGLVKACQRHGLPPIQMG